MISEEELCGIIDTLGALKPDEIQKIADEIASVREYSGESFDIESMCQIAKDRHLVETIFPFEIKDEHENLDSSDVPQTYYINGPCSFPVVPPELSEVIDILEIERREIDMHKISIRYLDELNKKVFFLDKKADSMNNTNYEKKDVIDLENEYSELLNMYYDFESWLIEDIENVQEVESIETLLMNISTKLESLKESI
ncbi:conserved hypothetical protein [Methanosalsum zhilinae DSM 4017]|uniref:Uncharacterized protein n=1 Tax=Methanosalsum zhilinae (strain DSM 4017 / NBRC 107636 / OCM 62 / WeN5) TaxID=679901 RepID=F7XLF2_METZD|nr:hypothetical protein [Methanosalsum zhilinae]AEH60365.1 conserved hypothetical protein [Methanosalsum zhilinae DSM 4017]